MNKGENNESGVVLIVVLLLMLVFTVMILGFYFETSGEQAVAASDRDNSVAFYAATGAIENMSSNLASLFASTASPTVAQVSALTGTTYQPSIPIYNANGTSSGTYVTFPTYAIGNPSGTTLGASLSSNPPGTIPGNGPLAGLMGIITPFTLTVVADGPNNTEVKMVRQVQEVAVPVFQYGIFSQTDLSFFAGPNFGFGGRTATNGNLFLAEGSSGTSSPATLTLNDKVTAYLNVIRTQLSNGTSTTSSSSNYQGYVDITIGEAGGCPTPTCGSCNTSTCARLKTSEGSLTGGPGSSLNTNWNTISMGTGSGDYNAYIRDGNGGATGGTGVKQLNLALALAGATPVAMIERPPTTELPSSQIGQLRFFNQASVRILLSDSQTQITSEPGVTSSAPYPLADAPSSGTSGMTVNVQRTNSGNPYYLPATNACSPPFAQSPGYTADNDYMSPIGTTLVGGYIKVEVQLNSSTGTWQDVTQEVLSLGVSRDSMTATPMTSLTGSQVNGSGLTTTSTYYYEVTAVGPWGESLPSAQTSGISGSKGEIKLTWNSVTGATGYNIYRTTSTGNYSSANNGFLVEATPGATTTYTDANSPAPAAAGGPAPPTACTNNSILHLEEGIPGEILGTTSYKTATNYIPLNMYDPREGEVRDITNNPDSTASLNGIMNLVEIDVGHLQQWLAGKLVPPYSACSGTTVLSPLTGSANSCGPLALGATAPATATAPGQYILYISDRRGNCNQTTSGPCSGSEGTDTGYFGNEDIINPSSGTGTPNGVMDTATAGTGSCPAGGSPCPIEDVVGDGVFRTYGATPHPLAIDSNATWAKNMISAMGAYPATNPAFERLTTNGGGPCGASAGCQAQKNSVIVFRRAVRLVDGTLGNLPPYLGATLTTCPNSSGGYPANGGFSVASEGPVYIWGDYNANHADSFSSDPGGTCHVPAAVFADAVTLLSYDWADTTTFTNPTNMGDRPKTTDDTSFRVAAIAGKNLSFPLPTFTSPAAPPDDFGTDGGTHNFLRYIENWNTQLNYLGSLVSFYIAVQGTGVYKCCNTVYSAPTRNFAYDTDFTNIGSMPPGTPRFTDVNALSYQQAILATQ